MHGCGWNYLSGGGMAGWPLFFLAVALTFFALVHFTRTRRRNTGGRDRRDSLEILKRRLASGEITIEEFETLKRYL